MFHQVVTSDGDACEDKDGNVVLKSVMENSGADVTSNNVNGSVQSTENYEGAKLIKLPCLLQYILFPPLNHNGLAAAAAANGFDLLSPSSTVGSGPLCLTDAATVDNGIATAAAASVAASATAHPATPSDLSSVMSSTQGLRIVSELWVEPQGGCLCDLPHSLRSLKGLSYKDIADQVGTGCFNSACKQTFLS